MRRVSSFELNQTTEGGFELIGEMSFETAAQILKSSERSFAQHAETQVNLSQVSKADSAGLALLLEWIGWANHSDVEIRFLNIPKKILAIAQTAEVDELLSGSYSSSQPTP